MTEETAPRRSRGRPPGSSRAEIERAAIGLFLAHGYAGTSLAMITGACGISKTSFFRYYPSKAQIIWSAFDEHTRALRALLERADPEVPLLRSVRHAVVEALRGSIDAEGLWMRRFIILDSSPELRAEESLHWDSWADVIAERIADRTGTGPHALVPASIGGALQAAFLATLRTQRDAPDPAATVLRALEDDLAPLCDVLQSWLDAGRAAA
ncbi:acyl-CoA-like ligand-binding transcription factor [Streptomyces xiamenensis]